MSKVHPMQISLPSHRLSLRLIPSPFHTSLKSSPKTLSLPSFSLPATHFVSPFSEFDALRVLLNLFSFPWRLKGLECLGRLMAEIISLLQHQSCGYINSKLNLALDPSCFRFNFSTIFHSI